MSHFTVAVDNAIILAAGFGSRFVPFTFEKPKGLIEVNGVPMLEAQLRQLHEAGITDITIVTGYLRKEFQPLIKAYGLKEIVNPHFRTQNTISSLYAARHELKNTLILSSDNFLKENIYRKRESTPWYCLSYSKGPTREWCVEENDEGAITHVTVGGKDSWHMYGPAFFTQEFSQAFLPLLKQAYSRPSRHHWYWEDVLIRNLDKLPQIYANHQPGTVLEFESWEELRQYDVSYALAPKNDCLARICQYFHVSPTEISGVECIKQGKTNQSFSFWVASNRYVYRRPGPGTSGIVDRHSEHLTLQLVDQLGISDQVIYFEDDTGHRISHFIQEARTLDASAWNEVNEAMSIVRQLHESDISIPHTWDFSREIRRYKTLLDPDAGSERWDDFTDIRQQIVRLLDIVDALDRPHVLCHGDCIPDNFLVDANNRMCLIDWEYSGMGDPLIDPVMFAIAGNFNLTQQEKLWHSFLQRPPTSIEMKLFHTYLALAGYLWTLWCLYKENNGVDFGDYMQCQIAFAREFAPLALEEWGRTDDF